LMIVPIFQVSQNEVFIFLNIQAPHIKAKEIDFYVSGNQFRFYARPFYLRLTFPHEFAEESGLEKASYDYGSGVLTVQIPKLNKGEFFENLDMLTKLLEKKNPQSLPIISEIGERDPTQEDNDEELDWEMEQNLPPQLSADELLRKPHYGFNNQYVAYFQPLQDDIKEILELPTPDEIPAEQRSTLRLDCENRKFEPEYYMMDFVFDEQIQEVLKFECSWKSEFEKKIEYKKKKKSDKEQKEKENQAQVLNSTTHNLQTLTTATPFAFEPPVTPTSAINPASLTPASLIQFMVGSSEPTKDSASNFVFGQSDSNSNSNSVVDVTDRNKIYEKQKFDEELIAFNTDHKEILLRLPNKSYLIHNEKAVMLGLLDILFAFTYNHLSTMGENTVESAWTICKISPTLSWFVEFQTVKQTLVSCIRRSLAYPLYRHWELSMKVLECTKMLFQLGKRALLRSLIDTKRIFDKSDFQHHQNRLYIDDYCVYIQGVRRKKIKSLVKDIGKVNITKQDIEWPLIELEKQALEKAAELPEDEMQE